jgi:GT2 family glycosyltransferase
MMITIAVLITCHNRKDKTLACLEALYAQERLGLDFNVEVFLVDDGSSDGTSEAIRIQFPEVNIIQGDGNLYWNRGMHLAWETAAKTKNYDYYLWLNDDTFLYPSAISVLLPDNLNNVIICGSTACPQTGKLTYGGRKLKEINRIPPTHDFQVCDYFNGNCVLIPRAIFEQVGNLDLNFHHALGDFDYGLRARKLGFKAYITPHFIGTCESHRILPKWCSPSEPIFNRFKQLYSPASGCRPPEYFLFDSKHFGFISAILHFFSIHLRALYPKLWKQTS